MLGLLNVQLYSHAVWCFVSGASLLPAGEARDKEEISRREQEMPHSSPRCVLKSHRTVATGGGSLGAGQSGQRGQVTQYTRKEGKRARHERKGLVEDYSREKVAYVNSVVGKAWVVWKHKENQCAWAAVPRTVVGTQSKGWAPSFRALGAGAGQKQNVAQPYSEVSFSPQRQYL